MFLFVQNSLPHYRAGFYNELSVHEEVIVVHSGTPNRKSGDKFREKIIPVKRHGPFLVQQKLLQAIEEEKPKTIIAMFDIRWINTIRAMFRFDRALNWIWWGLDEGGNDLALKIKCLLARRNNPIVFYNNAVRSRFIELGLDNTKLFIANNTFHVANSTPCFRFIPKDKFINVGTLDARKQNEVTIKVFKTLLAETGRDLKLVLIGEGQERKKLEELIAEEGLADNIIMPGKIEDPKILMAYYQTAIASVSFGQAGLAVLQSMAFGVPFVTKTNAISGGEKYNIDNGINGIFCEDSPESLEQAMRSMIESPSYASQLGRNAYEHYKNHASVKNMVEGFICANRYAENNRG